MPLDSSEVRLSFLIQMGPSKDGQMEGAFFPPLGIENNAKFSIAFVLKISFSQAVQIVQINNFDEVICRQTIFATPSKGVCILISK